MKRYWKADKATGKKIIEIIGQWDDIKTKASKLAKSVGANHRKFVTTSGFGLTIAGFLFDDPSKIDPKKWVRVKNTGAWRPRRNKSELCKAFDALRCDSLTEIANLIGMEQWDGLTHSTPGVLQYKGTVYVTTTDKTKQAKGCTRITDMEFEAVQKKVRA